MHLYYLIITLFLVCMEPGLILSKMRKPLYYLSVTLLSTQEIHRNMVKRLCITLKKSGTSNKIGWCVQVIFSSFGKKKLTLIPSFYFGKDERKISARLLNNQNPGVSYLCQQSPLILVSLHSPQQCILSTGPNLRGFWKIFACENTVIHQRDHIKNIYIFQAARVQLIYLPPYCSKLNPIRLVFAAIKIKLLQGTQEITLTLEPQGEVFQVTLEIMDPQWTVFQVTVEIMNAEFCYIIYNHHGYSVETNHQ
ncbi:hypothetical protein VP01_1109g4 [Puccinia sorghi]|uniref:Tc1-like transposase DDE domain-containing protein n=1 Tax=Puccinia sorghi TaxID=27349 RepID=A0A0L6VSY0_9BASI|nr:hypothetical protein VP01_1109g4 [Puccinia sorghi]